MAGKGSIVTFEKPIHHLGLADWQGRVAEQTQTANTRREDAFEFRHQSRQLRNEANIKTNWDTFHNNARLADRITELERWRETLAGGLTKLDRDMASLRDEKSATERDLDFLGIHIGILNECITARDARLGTELTYDDADVELKKELCVAEGVKKMLTDRCQSSWEKINRLEEVKFKLNLDLNDKKEAIDIDKDLLTLDKNCANITFKPDALRVSKRSIPYQTWIDHSRYVKLLVDNELADTSKVRESLFIVRERAKNDLKAQRDTTDYTLRKRIYETQRSRNELEWQQLKMREEMEKILSEINVLDGSFLNKTDALKLAETRLEHRTYRPGYEIARDEAELGLRDEVMQLRQSCSDLQDKLDAAKATYNALEDMQVRLDKDLANKSQALMTDIRCLDLRARLHSEKCGETTQTQRNIILTRMEKEIPEKM